MTTKPIIRLNRWSCGIIGSLIAAFIAFAAGFAMDAFGLPDALTWSAFFGVILGWLAWLGGYAVGLLYFED